MTSLVPRVLFLPMLLLACLPAAPLGATTTRQLSTEELVLDAELIVAGTCIEVVTARLDGQLMTLATIDVAESLKGEPPAELTVVLPGGIDTTLPVPVQVVYAGQARVIHGDELLLFLRPFAGDGQLTAIVGFSQGAFRIYSNGDGQRLLRRDLSGLLLEGGAGVEAGGVSTISFETLRRQIDEIVAFGGER